MQYFVMRSGLEIFDTCRAYGLAELLRVLTPDQQAPLIRDVGSGFLIEAGKPDLSLDLEKDEQWLELKGLDSWDRVFLTNIRRDRAKNREKVFETLQAEKDEIVEKAVYPGAGLIAEIGTGQSIPGTIDPTAFKGLRGTKTSQYSEKQMGSDEVNWALGCLGAAVAQRFQRSAAGAEFHVTLPVPEEVSMTNFHEVRDALYGRSIKAVSVRITAAYFAVGLAEKLRERASGNPFFPLRFSRLHYFLLFSAGQQYKPSTGASVGLASLTALAIKEPVKAYRVLQSWQYLLELGQRKGYEELALSTSELVLDPSLDSYERHVKALVRFVYQKDKPFWKEPYDEEIIEEVIKYASQEVDFGKSLCGSCSEIFWQGTAGRVDF